MNVFEAIQSRRAVKHFDASHKMSEAEISQLLSTASFAPSAFNIQHWRMVVVNDTNLRKEIRAAAWDQAQITDASLLIVLCADTKAWAKEPSRYWKNAPQAAQDFILPAIHQYYSGRGQVQRDEVMRSCGIVAQTLMLAAKAMDYDTCPMDGFDFEKVGALINLPSDHLISLIVTVGKCTKEPWPKAGQLGLDKIVINNKFA